MEDEIWKDADGYADLYMVSNHGRVWSKRSKKIMKKTKNSQGYHLIVSRVGGRKGELLSPKVHRLVAIAFIPNPENKPFVNHKDGDKLNNHVDNLEWCTRQENVDHAKEMGLLDECVKKGEKHGMARVTDDDVRKIRELKGKMTYKEIADMFNIGTSTAFDIANRRTWKHID